MNDPSGPDGDHGSGPRPDHGPERAAAQPRPDRARISAHDRRRLRASWWMLAGGGVTGLVGMAAVAIIGGSGRAGLAVLLLLTAAGAVLAALLTAVLAMVDEYRRVPAGRSRTITALALFLGGGLLLIMSLGVAGG